MKKKISIVLVLALGLVAGIAKADFTFGTPTKVPNINSSYNEFNASISADGLSLYFISNRPGGVGGTGKFAGLDIWVTTRETTDDPWGAPVNLGPTVNSTVGEAGVSISSDGLSLYLDTLQPGSSGAEDLYVATRATTDNDWGSPVNLGPTVNSWADDTYPSISADGLELYFTTIRSGGYGNYDLWVTTRETIHDSWGTPQNLGPTVNSSTGDGQTSISADGRMLFFASSRSGGYGQMDIWVTRRATIDDLWGQPVNLGSTINTSGWEQYPNVSADGSTLYFRYSQSGRWGNDGDIWQAPIVPIVDFNGDEIVDLKDFSKLAQHWRQNEPSVDMGPTPLGDGVVNIQDVVGFAEYWLKEILPRDLIAYWKLDETEGMVAHDSAGDNDGALMTENPLWRPLDGMIHGALELDGIDDFVSTDFVLNPDDGPLSVFAWVRGGAPGQVILSQAASANWLSANATTGALMTELIPGLFGKLLSSQAVITDGDWHHVGLTWNKPDRILYVDGVEVAKDTQSGVRPSDRGLNIGADKNPTTGSFFTGLIDDVRIYDQALSAKEIEELAR